MSSLRSISEDDGGTSTVITYNVVKFIVKVKLVENRANRTVGRVIVMKVMIQTRVPGTALAMTNRPCPMNSSHEVDSG